MCHLIKKIIAFLLTYISISLVLYSLFWLANFHLRFAYSLAGEDISTNLEAISTTEPEGVFKKNAFWLGYAQWLGLYPKPIFQLSFSQLGVPLKQTLHNWRGEAVAQRWLVLLQNAEEKLILYSSPNYPIIEHSSSLPDFAQIKKWKEIHSGKFSNSHPGWQVTLVTYQGILQGYWGESLSFSRPVTVLVLSRLPLTFILGLMSFLLAYILALPLAHIWLYSHKSLVTFIKSFCLFFFSAPHVILGLLLLYLFAWQLKYFPLRTLPWWTWEESPAKLLFSLVLPAISLALPILITNSLLVARRLEGERKKDYVLFAQAKGLSETRITFVHLLKPSLSPLLVRSKNFFSLLICGSLIIENLFGITGVGQLSWQALINNDLTLGLALSNLIFFSHLCGEFLSEALVNLWHKNTAVKI